MLDAWHAGTRAARAGGPVASGDPDALLQAAQLDAALSAGDRLSPQLLSAIVCPTWGGRPAERVAPGRALGPGVGSRTHGPRARWAPQWRSRGPRRRSARRHSSEASEPINHQLPGGRKGAPAEGLAGGAAEHQLRPGRRSDRRHRIRSTTSLLPTPAKHGTTRSSRCAEMKGRGHSRSAARSRRPASRSTPAAGFANTNPGDRR